LLLSFASDPVHNDILLVGSVVLTLPLPFEKKVFFVFAAETPKIVFGFRGLEIVLPFVFERSGADDEL